MLVGQREKSQKYFDLSVFNKNLNDSNPCSSLGVMNFQKWELFSGSPGMTPICAVFFKFRKKRMHLFCAVWIFWTASYSTLDTMKCMHNQNVAEKFYGKIF